MLIEFNDKIFPANLKYLRRKRGLSQIELARRTGIGVYLIRGIENCRLYPRMTMADYEQLCKVLRVAPGSMESDGISPSPAARMSHLGMESCDR